MSLLRNRILVTAALGHFSVDMYSGMLPLILLGLTGPLHLTYSQVGLVSMAFSLAQSVSPPIFGWWGDKNSNRAVAAFGVAGIACAMGLMRFADHFAVLMVLAPIAGMGSGAFHPQGAVLAAHVPPRERGSAMSIYMMGGSTGYALGPIIASAIFLFAGTFMPELVGAVGIVQAALVFWALAGQERARAGGQAPIVATTRRAATSVIVLLTLIIFVRSWLSTTVTTFLPQVIHLQGNSDQFAGQVLFAILMPMAIGGLIGGTVSDRIGRRRVLIVSTAVSGPALWALLNADSAAVFLWGALLGIALGASTPVTLVMAQELVPRGLGVMSGIFLGFMFIAGAVGVSVNGFAADQVGLMPTLLSNAALPLAAAVLSCFLPDDQPGARALVPADASFDTAK